MTNKSKNKRKLSYLILLLLIAFVIIYRVMNNIKFSMIRYGEINVFEKTKGIILTTEKVYSASMDGYIKYKQATGTRVGVGDTVATIYKKKSEVTSLKQKIQNINKKISQKIDYNTNDKRFKSDIEKMNVKIKNELKDIQLNIQQENVSKIYDNTNNLKALIGKRFQIAKTLGIKDLGISQTSLSNEKEHLQRMVNANEDVVKTDESGLFSYFVDGYEGKLDINNFDVKSVKKFIDDYEIINKKKEEIKVGQPVYKLMDNFNWKLLCTMDTEQVKGLSKGNYVYIDLLNNPNKRVDAVVDNIKQQGNSYLVSFQLNSMLEGIYNRRVVNFKVIKQSYSGFEVPNKAIVKSYLLDICVKDKLKVKDYLKNLDFKVYKKSNKATLDTVNISGYRDLADTNKYHFILAIENEISNIKKDPIAVSMIEDGNEYLLNKKEYKIKHINAIYISKMGVAQYYPIKLLTMKDDGYSIIDSYTDDYNQNFIKYYDRVIITPNKVKNKQIVD